MSQVTIFFKPFSLTEEQKQECYALVDSKVKELHTKAKNDILHLSDTISKIDERKFYKITNGKFINHTLVISKEEHDNIKNIIISLPNSYSPDIKIIFHNESKPIDISKLKIKTLEYENFFVEFYKNENPKNVKLIESRGGIFKDKYALMYMSEYNKNGEITDFIYGQAINPFRERTIPFIRRTILSIPHQMRRLRESVLSSKSKPTINR